MDTLFSRHRNSMALVALLFLQLVLLAFQVKRDKDVPLIRIWAISILTPIESATSGFVYGFGGIWHDYVDLRGARRENRQLSEELSRLKIAHHHLQEEALEARRLKTLLQFRSEIPSSTIPARVIGSSASENSRVLLIDAGSNMGIRPNMGVITPDGIVGKVFRVFWASSQVLVITDPDSGVGALLENSRVHGALRGHGGFFCQLRYIVADEKVDVGEHVYTSGEDLIYPKGLPIGTVTAVKTGAVFKEITVQPFARLNRLEEVLVITRNADQEIPTRPVASREAPAPVAGVTPTAPSAAEKRAAGEKRQPVGEKRQPVPGLGDGARARPQTDADKLLEQYRTQAAKAQAGRPAPAASPAVDTPPPGITANAPAPTTTTPPAPAVSATTPRTTPPAGAAANPGDTAAAPARKPAQPPAGTSQPPASSPPSSQPGAAQRPPAAKPNPPRTEQPPVEGRKPEQRPENPENSKPQPKTPPQDQPEPN